MEDTKQEIITDKTQIIDSFQNRKFDDLVEPKKLVDIGKLSRSDYTDIIDAGKRQIETFLSSDLFDIRSAGKIREILELEIEDIFHLIIRCTNKLLDANHKDEAFETIEFFNKDDNLLVTREILYALDKKMIEIAVELIYKYKIDNYVDPDKKFNIPKEIKEQIYEIKKSIFEHYEILKNEKKYKFAAELTKFLANKRMYQIETTTAALNNGYYNDAKNIIEDYKIFENELSQPDTIKEKLTELRNIKRKHYNIQFQNKKYETALLIAELDPDRGRDSLLMINNTANHVLNEIFEEISKFGKIEDNPEVIGNKLKKAHTFLNEYNIINETYIEHGTEYLKKLFEADMYEEARFFYRTLKEKYEEDINKDLWQNVIKHCAKLVEDKLIDLIEHKPLSELENFIKNFDYKFDEESNFYKEVDNKIQVTLNKSIENSYEEKLYMRAAKIIFLLNIKPTTKTRKLAQQVFIEVLNRAKINVNEALEKGSKYQKSHAENFKDVYFLGKYFRISDYDDALINAFIIYSKLLEFTELENLFSKNNKEFSNPKIQSKLIVFMQKEKKEWKKNPHAVAEFDRLGKSFFGDAFFEKQQDSFGGSGTDHRSIFYTVFIAPWIYIVKALFHIFFKKSDD